MTLESSIAFQNWSSLKSSIESSISFQNPCPSRYRLDALSTELLETRGEQGHMLGSYMCDMCPATLQGSTCRNDKCE